MKTRIFLIMFAILSVLLFMAGCGGGYAEQGYTPNPNEQHIYVHQVNDPTYDMYLQQQMQRQSMQDFTNQTNKTLNDMDETLRRMHQNNMGNIGVINGARQQWP